jgi:flagellin-like hook-associated protein FlgL
MDSVKTYLAGQGITDADALGYITDGEAGGDGPHVYDLNSTILLGLTGSESAFEGNYSFVAEDDGLGGTFLSAKPMVLVGGQWQEDQQGVPYPLDTQLFTTIQDVEDWLSNAIPPVTPINLTPDSGSGGDHNGTILNSLNVISFLQTQDNLLESAGQILDRMSELKALYSDPFATQNDTDGYNTEFEDLQTQLYAISQESFDGIPFFDRVGTLPFNSKGTTQEVNIQQDGYQFDSIEILQLAFLSGLTFTVNSNGDTTTTLGEWTDVNSGGNGASVNAGIYSLAVDSGTQLSLGALPTEIFSMALENISVLRAHNSNKLLIANVKIDIGISPNVVDPSVSGYQISNTQSFLQLQDKFLEKAGTTIDRIAELKAFTGDVLKSDFEKYLFNLEFSELQNLLFDFSQGSYNNLTLFDSNGTVPFASRGSNVLIDLGGGENLEIKKLALLTAVTFEIDANGEANTTLATWNDINEGGDNFEITSGTYSFAVNDGKNLLLESITNNAIISALENISTLRSINAEKQQDLNLLVDQNSTSPGSGGDHNGTQGLPVYDLSGEIASSLVTAPVPEGNYSFEFYFNQDLGVEEKVMVKAVQDANDSWQRAVNIDGFTIVYDLVGGLTDMHSVKAELEQLGIIDSMIIGFIIDDQNGTGTGQGGDHNGTELAVYDLNSTILLGLTGSESAFEGNYSFVTEDDGLGGTFLSAKPMVLVGGQWQEDQQGVPYPLDTQLFTTIQDVEDWLSNAIPPVTPINLTPDSGSGGITMAPKDCPFLH